MSRLKSRLSRWFRTWSLQPVPCRPPSGLTQKAEEGLELLVLAGTERHPALILTAPGPQLHLGGHHLGRGLGVTHLMEGGGR